MTEDIKIVIIEDEPDTVEMFAEMMHLSGYQVLKVYGGVEAVETIRTEQLDVVVLDMMMPDVSGMDVLRAMHADPELADIPVVIVSAMSLPKDIRRGLDAGAAAYLTKPVSFQKLRETVDAALRAASDNR
jgi:DNA-binding response OmpR family regulator